jgi:hypothetical protein
MLLTVSLAVLVCLLGAGAIGLAHSATVVDHNEAYCLLVDGEPRTVTGLDLTLAGRSASETAWLPYGPTRRYLTRSDGQDDLSVHLAVSVTDPALVWEQGYHADDPVASALDACLDELTADGTALTDLDTDDIVARTDTARGIEIHDFVVYHTQQLTVTDREQPVAITTTDVSAERLDEEPAGARTSEQHLETLIDELLADETVEATTVEELDAATVDEYASGELRVERFDPVETGVSDG